MLINFKLRGGAPVYEQLYTNFADNIRAGLYNPNDPLPYVRQVAKDANVNPNTVQRTYKLLEQHGYIYTIPAKGSYVCETLPLPDDSDRLGTADTAADTGDTADVTADFRAAAARAVHAGVSVDSLAAILRELDTLSQ